MTLFKQGLKDRFSGKVLEMGSGCHEWQSTLHRDGYGKFWMDGRQRAAHRVSFLLAHGSIDDGKMVLHKCDNRKCVNPDHLYIGDAKQNAKDKIERRNEWHSTKISFDSVKKVREMYATGQYTQQELAGLFGCDQTQISRYVRNDQRLNY